MVVGSFVMDQIAITDVFPREGQTVLGSSFRKAPGGKGANQAVQAARLGGDVTRVGKLGNDSNGEELLNVCQASGLDLSHVLYDENIASGCAVVVLHKMKDGSTQNRIIVIPGSNMSITAEDIQFLEQEIALYDVVILQQEIPMDVNVMVAKYAAKANVPVFLNPAPSAVIPDELYQYLSFIAPNETELEDMTGVRIDHNDQMQEQESVRRAVKILRAKGVKDVLVTLGSAGALLTTDEGEIYAPSATNVEAVDPTAAGDSFVGAFCIGVCCGWDWATILQFANQTAAITVSRPGAMPSLPTFEMVAQCMSERGLPVPVIDVQCEK